MWIEPNGQVKIIKNVDLDNRYNNTIYFANRTAQYNYFNSKVKYAYDKISYQRVNKNHLRVEINAENLYDCNYLMFQNTNFGNRWFYAFIIKVEYISNKVSDVEYQIDEMQTWFFDCELGESFIEREHSVRDIIYTNLVDEQLELGEYFNNEYIFPHDAQGNLLFTEMVAVFGCTFYIDGGLINPFVEYGINSSGGLVSALNYITFPISTNGLIECNLWIDQVTRRQKKDGIVTAFLMPKLVADSFTVPVANMSYCRQMYGHAVEPAQAFTLVDTYDKNMNGSYMPRNNKLLSYPFKFLHVTDFHGQSGEYRYEFFNHPEKNDRIAFKYTMGMTPEPSMLVTPLYYKNNEHNDNEFFVVKCYPMVGYSIDGFKMWLAENWGSLLTQGANVGNSLWAGIHKSNYSENLMGYKYVNAGNPATNFGSPLTNALGMMTQIAQHTQMPTFSMNNPTADAQWCGGLRGFAYCDMHISEQFARRIDDFFDMFGYKTCEVKIPNINSRPHWNYIKTSDANIFGNIPADSLRIIRDIFDRGITFWKNGDEIGDYRLDNRPE